MQVVRAFVPSPVAVTVVDCALISVGGERGSGCGAQVADGGEKRKKRQREIVVVPKCGLLWKYL